MRVTPRPSALLLATSLALGGCVAFEQSPIAQLRCDPALPGHWLPLLAPEDEQSQKPHVAATIDSDCTVRLREELTGNSFPPFAANGFALRERHYAVLAGDAIAGITGDGGVTRDLPEGAVFLLQYRIEGDVLSVGTLRPEDFEPLAGGAELRSFGGASLPMLLEGDPQRLLKTLGQKDDWLTTQQGVRLLQFRRATVAVTPPLAGPPVP